MGTAVDIILLAALVYLGLCVALYLVQDLFMFHPERLPQDFKFNFSDKFEETFVEVEDGSRINGLYFHAENPKGVVFYFKGNTRSVKGWGKFHADFIPKGYDFFVVDYPGFGKSIGQRTEHRVYHDVHLAYKWLAERWPEKKIVVYGRSLGSGFAAGVASWSKPRMLILDSPFFSFDQLARRYAFMFPLSFILKYKMPLYKHVKELNCPLFILHGDKDRLIPYKYSPMIVRIAPERIKLFTIHGASHNNLPEFPAYHEALDKILNDEDLYAEYKPQNKAS